MPPKDVVTPIVAAFPTWVKKIGYKVPLTILSLLLLVLLLESSPPSFLSFSRLSSTQIESILDSQAANETSSTTAGNEVQHDIAPSVAPVTVHTDSPNAEEQSAEPQEQKKRPAETVKPDNQTQSNTPVADSSIITTNATSDVPAVEDDTRLVGEAVNQGVEDPQYTVEAKYIIPLLSTQLGTGNQLMEYKSAATIARTLNRTLCLIPFFGGPSSHQGRLGNKRGLYIQERYDTEVLSKYVTVASMDECSANCEMKVDAHWRLTGNRAPNWKPWFNDTPKSSTDFPKVFRKWNSTADVGAVMSPLNEAKCVGLGGLFPGLNWRGVFYAASTYMQHSQKISKAADFYQKRALGSTDNNFIAVHWRFEESKCQGRELGLCYPRRPDGSVITNGRASETWTSMRRDIPRPEFWKGYNFVIVQKTDISGAIYDRAKKHGVKNVYLATDGWLRGDRSSANLKWVVEDLRSKGLHVVGLWMIPGLANFADGYFVHPGNVAELFGLDPKEPVSNPMIALVEQEICFRSPVFVGSGQSSWSLAVADTRRGRRCKKELHDLLTGLHPETPPEVMEQEVIDRILSIPYTAGPTCRGDLNLTIKTWEDEAPDGWLDYDACEGRLLSGVGQCIRSST